MTHLRVSMVSIRQPIVEPTLDLVSTYGPWFPRIGNGGSPSSTAYESANRTVYYPLFIPTRLLLKRVFWANGATTTGGATITAGLYADAGFKPGIRVVTGGATQNTGGGAEAESKLQFVDVTDKWITPGSYWLAIAATSITNTTLQAWSGSGALNNSYKMQESTGTVLPATATPIQSVSGNFYAFGFSTDTVT
jgi:hypothetical protein